MKTHYENIGNGFITTIENYEDFSYNKGKNSAYTAKIIQTVFANSGKELLKLLISYHYK